MGLRVKNYPKIKLCGIRRREDIETICEGYIPDYIGFVFALSKRQVTKAVAKDLTTQLHKISKEIQIVGVFVNAMLDEIVEIALDVPLDVIQLHGNEPQEFIALVKERLPNKEIWKAFRVKKEEDIGEIDRSIEDFIVLDAYQEGIYGGTGKSIDLGIVQQFEKRCGKGYFLAGGINLENIQEIARVVGPYGLDMSSGLETDGYKDKNKIKNMIKSVREELVWEQKEGLENSEGSMCQKL